MSRWRSIAAPSMMPAGTRAFQLEVSDGHLTAFVSGPVERQALGGWHLSISHHRSLVDPFTKRFVPGRIPTWEEIRDARYDLIPDDVTMAMLLPPSGEYVNLHTTTMHLHEVSGDDGAPTQWRTANHALQESTP